MADGAGFDIVPGKRQIAFSRAKLTHVKGHEIVADIVAVPASEKNWKVRLLFHRKYLNSHAAGF